MTAFDPAQAAREWLESGGHETFNETYVASLTALAERAYAAGYEAGQRRAFEYYALSKPGFASTTNRNPFEDIQP